MKYPELSEKTTQKLTTWEPSENYLETIRKLPGNYLETIRKLPGKWLRKNQPPEENS